MIGKIWKRWQALERSPARRLFHSTRLGVEGLEDRAVPASLAGQVYIDANFDGFKQAAEPGLAGVSIHLTGTDSNNAAVDLTLTTDGSGNFNFTNLLAGTYALTEVQPGGFITAFETVGTAGGNVASNNFSNIVLAANQLANGYLFGEQGIHVTGRVFNDANANGVLDGGESGRAGVLVTLADTTRNSSVPTLTDANGNFSFTGLAPGSYTLTTTNSDTTVGFTTPGTISFTIGDSGEPNGELPNQNFGLSQIGEIRGLVYHDKNNNGFFDAGDVGINNVSILLAGQQNNSQTVNRSLTTSPDGTFRFTGVLAGSYSLIETPPSGFENGTISVGTAGGFVGTNAVVGINLGAGVIATGYNFGQTKVTLASLGGVAFIDVNHDGVKQNNEPGLSGVIFQLTGTDDQGNFVNLNTSSDSAGNFSFTGLRPGTYTLTETQPANFGNGTTTAGTAGGNVSGDSISNIVLTSGVNATNYRFGEIGNQVTGQVFNDLNANGVRDGAEVGRAGVLLTLTNNDTNVAFNVLSDASGNFTFSDLGPGSYTLTATNPQPLTLGFTTSASQAITIPGDGVVGGVVNDKNFGLSQQSELNGIVYDDRNHNGVFDAGDVGIGGVQLVVQGTQNNGVSVTNRAVTTQANGTFRVTGLLAGVYSVTETQPANFDEGSITVGSAGGIVGTNAVTNIVLGAGVTATGYNFGEQQISFASLTGRVFIDINGDGVRQSNEPGIGDVVLTLAGTANNGDPVNLSVITSSDGTFSFTNVRPGTYTLTETQPANFANGTAKAGTAGGNVSGDSISNIVLGNGATAQNYFFGEIGNHATGQVFNDLNGNGVRDGAETGRSGVVLVLTNNSTGTSFTLVSDANGNFQFDNLGPGSYALAATNPDPVNLGFTTVSPLTFTIPNAGVVGGTVADQNVGLSQVSDLAGVVYNDKNNNGVFDAGDAGIGGVQIRIQGTQANGTSVDRTVSTDANGSYKLTNLLAGNYTITETQPNGFDEGTVNVGSAGGSVGANAVTNIVLGAGIHATGYNFGEKDIRFASLSGRVFIDRNNDGLFQSAEPGLAGVVVTLSGTANNGDAVNLTATTLGDGTFSFTNVRPGTYTLTETQPANFANGSARAGTAGGVVNGDSIANIVLGSNAQATDYLFGEIGNRISGKVFTDANANGNFDAGELGRSGVTVNLTGGGLSLSVVTDASGNYQFTDLGPGTFSITVTAPAGFGVTTQALSVTIPSNGLVGGEKTDQNIGLAQAGSLAGVIFLDVNNDGIQQANETGFSSLQLTLTGVLNNGTNFTRTITSGQDGKFLFETLLAGTYTLTPTVPNGVRFGIITVGSAGGTAGSGNITGISLGVGQVATGYSFALRSNADRGILAGNVFLDRNKNGRRDAGDLRSQDLTSGIQGVTIQLIGRDNFGNSVNLSTQTDFNGNYVFTNLAAGKYRIIEVQPQPFLDGKTFLGSLGGRARRNVVDTLTLSAGAIGAGYDFSEVLPSASRRALLASRYLT